MTATETAQMIARNRIAKAQRIARAIAKAWGHVIRACLAERVPGPTYANLADAIETSAAKAERTRFTLCMFVSEEASRETWEVVVRIVRSWAESDARAERAP